MAPNEDSLPIPFLLSNYGKAELLRGAGAFAVVQTNVAEPGTFLVLSLAAPCHFESFAAEFKRKVEQLPGTPKMEWVRALTRRLQRLFGWGDVASTREMVSRACNKKDEEELMEILPDATGLIDRGELELLPALHDALQSEVPALTDCQHEFFHESPYHIISGPCARGARGGRPEAPTHTAPYTRCAKCKLVLCARCARDEEADQNHRGALRAALQECKQKHSSPFDPICEYICHCESPRPFFVIDQQKVPNDEKVRWIEQELGSGADLVTFSTKFLDLFGEKLRGHTPQKRACLELFAMYNGASTAKKESDLAPEDAEAFQKVWNPQAPRRCRECNKPLPATALANQFFCDAACEAADKKTVCRKCGANAYWIGGCLTCSECGDAEKSQRLANVLKRVPNTNLDKTLQSNAQGLRILGNTWDFNSQADTEHVPAWTKRRRL